jgi:hypothetical protein
VSTDSAREPEDTAIIPWSLFVAQSIFRAQP